MLNNNSIQYRHHLIVIEVNIALTGLVHLRKVQTVIWLFSWGWQHYFDHLKWTYDEAFEELFGLGRGD